jgi:type II secretory pathway component GspD/PulD (secretin)
LASAYPDRAAAANAPQVPAAASPDRQRAQRLRDLLSHPISIEFDAGPLKEALGYLSERYDVPILVDAGAFKDDLMAEEVETQPVKLPKMAGVSLGTVLRILLAQVQGTYMLRRDYIEVTTPARARPEDWPALDRSRVPAVTAAVERRPLDQALQALSDSSGVSVLVNPGLGDRARAAVSADLNNVPVDTAVALLADMAGLGSVAVDNALYVTDKADAAALKAERERLRGLREGRGGKPRALRLVIEQQPLAVALGLVASGSGATVLLDPREKEGARATVTARLQNAPAEAAVRALADMAGLAVADLGGVYYVTTEGRAKALVEGRNKGGPKTWMPPADPD